VLGHVSILVLRRGGPLGGLRSDAGGRRAAAIYSLIESAKLNGLNPQHYLADLLVRIADHPARRIAELLPWNWQPLDTTRAAA
jgi:transposase